MSRQGRAWVSDRKEGHPRLNCRKCRANFRPTVLKEKWVLLAGAPGFEPGNGGIKIHCLTTWRRPSRRPDHSDFAGRALLRPHAASVRAGRRPRPSLPDRDIGWMRHAQRGLCKFSEADL